MKPDILTVLEVLNKKAQVKKLYDEIDEIVNAIEREFGDGRYDYDLSVLPEQDEEAPLFELAKDMLEKGQYFKFEIDTSLIDQLLSGEKVFRNVALSPVSYSSRSLKNCPKALK